MDIERFYSKTRRNGECLEWTGGVDKDGYGLFWCGGRTVRAHRFAYEQATGAAPEVVLHTCDNPRCVRASHLLGGTHSENQRDKKRKGRSAKGKANGGGGKLDEVQVREIKRRLNSGESQHSIARDFPCSRSTICFIKIGRIWKDV